LEIWEVASIIKITKKDMQSKTGSVVETFTTIIRDNIGNAFGIYVAKKWFGIDIAVSLQIIVRFITKVFNNAKPKKD
jgi:hypothetical protein